MTGVSPIAGVKARLAEIRFLFIEAGVATPDLDARLLVQETLGLSLTDLIARPDKAIDAAAAGLLEERVRRRLAGEPVHRILGHRAFYGLDLKLSAETLEPRPDTEVLVDVMRPHAAAIIERSGTCRILDLGTGTGAIALALLSILPGAIAVGTDVSAGALATAAENAAALGLGQRFETRESVWFAAFEEQFDVIVSNPPYIRSLEIAGLDEDVRRYDPIAALDGGIDGLDAYRAIAKGASDHLAQHGIIGLEIGQDQRAEVTGLFEAAGYRLIEARADLAGKDRVLAFSRG